MVKKRIKYRVNLPCSLDVPGYCRLDRDGETMASTKKQAAAFFLHRQNPSIRGLVLHALRKEYGSIEMFVEEVGKSNLRGLGLDEVYAFQTEDDLKNSGRKGKKGLVGGKMTKAELGLIEEYEIARELARRDGINEFKNSKIRFHYIDRARELVA